MSIFIWIFDLGIFLFRYGSYIFPPAIQALGWMMAGTAVIIAVLGKLQFYLLPFKKMYFCHKE